MIRVAVLAAFIAVAAGGCVRTPVRSAPPPALRTVAIAPPINLTGDELIVEGGSLLEKYVLDTPRVTVPEILTAEARRQLAARGVTVIAADAPAGAAPVLHLELRRWQPDAPFKPTYIIVALTASLVAPDTHRVLWSAEHPSRPVSTAGAISVANADLIAAARVMSEVLASLQSHAGAAGGGNDHHDTNSPSGSRPQ